MQVDESRLCRGSPKWLVLFWLAFTQAQQSPLWGVWTCFPKLQYPFSFGFFPGKFSAFGGGVPLKRVVLFGEVAGQRFFPTRQEGVVRFYVGIRVCDASTPRPHPVSRQSSSPVDSARAARQWIPPSPAEYPAIPPELLASPAEYPARAARQ